MRALSARLPWMLSCRWFDHGGRGKGAGNATRKQMNIVGRQDERCLRSDMKKEAGEDSVRKRKRGVRCLQDWLQLSSEATSVKTSIFDIDNANA